MTKGDRRTGNEMSTLVNSRVKLISLTAIMTPLVTLATMIFQIPIPATKGVFNLGDSMVYVSALLFGPYVGGFAGGVGSMLSDVLTDPIYAPGTLIIKGVEGFVVGILSQQLRMRTAKGKGRIILELAGLAVMAYFGLAAINILAIVYLAGSSGISSSLSGYVDDPMVWIIFSVIVVLVVGFAALYSFYRSDAIILIILIGGAFMVTGYFLYELVIFGIAAVVEVPANIVQVLSGIAIALPIYRGVRPAIVV